MDFEDLLVGLTDKLSRLSQDNGAMGQTLIGIGSVLPGVGDKLDNLTKSLERKFDTLDRSAQVSMTIGLTLDQTMEKLGASIDGLQGNFGQRFQASILPLEEGLKGNATEISRLINQQQLTGQFYNQTARYFRQNQLFLENNSEASNDLASTLIKYSDNYNITTGRLIDSLADLSDTLVVQRALGFNTETQDAIAQVVAKAGAGFEGPIKKLTDFLFSTREEDLTRQVIGLGPDALSRLQQAGSPEAQARVLVDLGERLSSTIEDSLAGAGSPEERRLTLQALSQAYGSDFVTLGLELKELRNSFDLATIDTGPQVDPGATVAASLGVIDVIRQRALALIAPQIQQMSSELAGGFGTDAVVPSQLGQGVNQITGLGNSVASLGVRADEASKGLINITTTLTGISTLGAILGIDTSAEAIEEGLENLISDSDFGSTTATPYYQRSVDYTNKSLFDLMGVSNSEELELIRNQADSLSNIENYVRTRTTQPEEFKKRCF